MRGDCRSQLSIPGRLCRSEFRLPATITGCYANRQQTFRPDGWCLLIANIRACLHFGAAAVCRVIFTDEGVLHGAFRMFCFNAGMSKVALYIFSISCCSGCAANARKMTLRENLIAASCEHCCRSKMVQIKFYLESRDLARKIQRFHRYCKSIFLSLESSTKIFLSLSLSRFLLFL